MQKSVNGILIIILCYILLPAGLSAQEDNQADAAILDTSLGVCVNEYGEEDTVHPCNRYIDANIEGHADTIKWLLELIQDRESSSKKASDALYARDQIVQWTLVVLALMTTIAAAITKGNPELKVYKIDFAIIPIILASSSAAVVGLP